MKLKVAEASVVDSVIHYLILKKIPHARITNSGNVLHRDGKVFFGRKKFQQLGVADIIACLGGVPLAIECKSSTGRVRKEQVEWLLNWKSAGGGESAICRDLGDLIDFITWIEGGRKLEQPRRTQFIP